MLLLLEGFENDDDDDPAGNRTDVDEDEMGTGLKSCCTGAAESGLTNV